MLQFDARLTSDATDDMFSSLFAPRLNEKRTSRTDEKLQNLTSGVLFVRCRHVVVIDFFFVKQLVIANPYKTHHKPQK